MSKAIIGFLIVLTAGITVAVIINMNYYSDDPESAYNRNKNNRLKVYNPADINPTLVDPSLQDKSKDHTIADFTFQNQLNESITQQDVAGKIFVVDYFFTTCGGICPKMTKQLKRVHNEFETDPNFLILSHTVNPKIDSVEVMYDYAEKFGANHNKWWFLTGTKKALYTIARKSYLLVPDKADPNFDHGEESDFIHTENFALIDPEGRIRGMYDGTNPGEVDELVRDVYDLKKEYNLN